MATFLPEIRGTVRRLERRLDLDLLDREVLGGLVGEEERDLLHELPEHLRGRLGVAEEAELVLDERVVDDGDVLGHDAHARYSG